MIFLSVVSTNSITLVAATDSRKMQDDTTTSIEDLTKVPLGLKETKLSHVVLPKPMSDFSTVYDTESNIIYISGGCDSINGNEYNLAAGGIFTCNQISNGHYMIRASDLSDTTQTNVSFTTLAALPTARYRHTAVLLPSQQLILLVGGRNVIDDSIIPTIDIYNINTDSWTSQNVTDVKYLLSDNTGLEYMDRAYIFGGWNASYTAMATSFYITVNEETNDSVPPSINFTDIADLPTPRGDTSSVSYVTPIANSTYRNSRETFALITGGFTHETLCNALDTVELYNFNTNQWTEKTALDTLTIARGDKVLVRTNHRSLFEDEIETEYFQQWIYAMGGERPIENYCDTFGEKNVSLEVGSETVPIDDIEYYNIINDTWTVFPNVDIDVYRFRFSAVVDPNRNIIYTLGGQLAFNKSCTCFPTSNEIYMYTEIFDASSVPTPTPPGQSPTTTTATPPSSSSSAGTIIDGMNRMMFATTVAFATIMIIIFN